MMEDENETKKVQFSEAEIETIKMLCRREIQQYFYEREYFPRTLNEARELGGISEILRGKDGYLIAAHLPVSHNDVREAFKLNPEKD